MILIKKHTVTSNPSDVRLVDYATGLFEEIPTKSSVKKAIRGRLLSANDAPATTGLFVKKGMVIKLYDDQTKNPKPYQATLATLYEDDHLAIVEKPPGVPTSGNQFRTLENMLAHQFELPESSQYLRWPRPVHRLDRLTSGLVLVAKSITARYKLGQAFERKEIMKTYHALVMGKTPRSGEMTTPVCEKSAHTIFQKLHEVRSLENDYLTLLKLTPKTGRTHQLRVHCAEAGFPIFGDLLYAAKTIRHKGLFLAATALSFKHPETNLPVNVQTDLPENFLIRMERENKRWEKYQ